MPAVMTATVVGGTMSKVYLAIEIDVQPYSSGQHAIQSQFENITEDTWMGDRIKLLMGAYISENEVIILKEGDITEEETNYLNSQYPPP